MASLTLLLLDPYGAISVKRLYETANPLYQTWVLMVGHDAFAIS